MKGQKQAVVDEIKLAIPGFVPYKDNAILILTPKDLEDVKLNITGGILNGTIEYSKDLTNVAEVRTYARSMVMNHLKKAKELNGGHAFVTNHSNSDDISVPRVIRTKVKIAPKGVNPDLLPEDLKEYARSLV